MDFYVLLIAFIILALFPFLLALDQFHTDKGEALGINQDYIVDPRYFAKSFIAYAKKLTREDFNERKIKLRDEERFLILDNTFPHDEIIRPIVLEIGGNYNLPKEVKTLKKEVVFKDSMIIDNDLTMKAMHGEEDLTFNGDINVQRWLDSENNLTLNGVNNLGVSTTCNNTLTITNNSSFKRLYAPKVQIRLTDDLPSTITTTSTIDEDLIEKKDYVVNSHTHLTKSIKGHKSIEIMPYTIIDGNVFADGDIIIHDHVHIKGNVFSQTLVKIGNDVTIGEKDTTRSVVCRYTIEILGNCTIYGLARCEEGGTIQKM